MDPVGRARPRSVESLVHHAAAVGAWSQAASALLTGPTSLEWKLGRKSGLFGGIRAAEADHFAFLTLSAMSTARPVQASSG